MKVAGIVGMRFRKTRSIGVFVVGVVLLSSPSELKSADQSSLSVSVDVADVPHLEEWGDDAGSLIRRWYPRLNNLLPTKGITPPRTVTFRIKKSGKGVGATSGSTITVSSSEI